MLAAVPLTAEDVGRFRDDALAAVRPLGDEVVADRERVDLIAEAERLKNALSALQAELSLDLDASVRSRDARQGVRPERQGRGVAAQIGLARQESPHRAGVLLGLAKDLATDLPCTLQAMREGRISEYRAMIIARESGCLGREDRARIDDDLCGTRACGTALGDTLGTGQLAGEVRKRAEAADPAAVARRNARAEQERRVSVRPAPDTMVYLTGLLPMAEGISAYASLVKEAERLIAAGDERGKGQIMADVLVERLTGTSLADGPGVNLNLIISDETLLGGGHEPATAPQAPGTGHIPAQIAREIIARALKAEAVTWIRTLYADPTGRLVAMSSKQRFAVDGLADFIGVRDQGICRTPWCDAPVRHHDHITPHATGGKTTADNTQGLCIACNLAKQADGWTHHTLTDPSGRHTVETTTPTGHRHRSRAPAPPPPARHHPPPCRIARAYYTPTFDLQLTDAYAA